LSGKRGRQQQGKVTLGSFGYSFKLFPLWLKVKVMVMVDEMMMMMMMLRMVLWEESKQGSIEGRAVWWWLCS
jgi:hypothetical protein